MKSEIKFADIKLKEYFEKLNNSKSVEKQLYKHIIIAFENLEKNAFCGIQIPKKLFPKKYKQFDNLWKYNLPNSWRLIYTVANSEIYVLTIILEWLNHKDYEKRFKY